MHSLEWNHTHFIHIICICYHSLMISYIINIIWYSLNIKNLWYHKWYHVAQGSRCGAIFKKPQLYHKMCAGMPRAARRLTHLANSVNSVKQVLLDLLSSVCASWKWDQLLFQVTLHENGSLHSQWPRIWAGAGGEQSNAQECLALFQDIILFRRQQSLTADSLI